MIYFELLLGFLIDLMCLNSITTIKTFRLIITSPRDLHSFVFSTFGCVKYVFENVKHCYLREKKRPSQGIKISFDKTIFFSLIKVCRFIEYFLTNKNNQERIWNIEASQIFRIISFQHSLCWLVTLGKRVRIQCDKY